MTSQLVRAMLPMLLLPHHLRSCQLDVLMGLQAEAYLAGPSVAACAAHPLVPLTQVVTQQVLVVADASMTHLGLILTEMAAIGMMIIPTNVEIMVKVLGMLAVFVREETAAAKKNMSKKNMFAFNNAGLNAAHSLIAMKLRSTAKRVTCNTIMMLA